jgi:gamma-glutamyltranspeptidase
MHILICFLCFLSAVQIHAQTAILSGYDIVSPVGGQNGLSPDTIRLLKDMGHTVAIKTTMGSAASILINLETNMYYGAADPRREGLAIGY